MAIIYLFRMNYSAQYDLTHKSLIFKKDKNCQVFLSTDNGHESRGRYINPIAVITQLKKKEPLVFDTYIWR